jgi:hypothetical protein
MEKGLEIKTSRPRILNKLNGGDVRWRNETAAFRMEPFPTDLPRGWFLFSDECFINLSSPSWDIIFWPNGILITRLVWKTIHHTSWYGEVWLSFMLPAHISLTERSTVFHILKLWKMTLYLTSPAEGPWNKWGLNKIVLHLISAWLCINSFKNILRFWCFLYHKLHQWHVLHTILTWAKLVTACGE